jgi:hypothetical protein
MRTIVIVGVNGGIGVATKDLLEAKGDRVIGVDASDADVVADLETVEGRQQAIAAVRAAADGPIHGIVTMGWFPGLRFDEVPAPDGTVEGVVSFPGIGAGTEQLGRYVTSMNYFAVVDLIEGLRDLLAASGDGAAIPINSLVTTIHPEPLREDIVDACLDHDEERARKLS